MAVQITQAAALTECRRLTGEGGSVRPMALLGAAFVAGLKSLLHCAASVAPAHLRQPK